MIKNLLIIIAVILVTTVSYGQTRISIFAGYGLSQFDDDIFSEADLDQTGYVPLGVNIEFGRNMFTFGIEASYSVLPFSFKFEEGGMELGELNITQLVVDCFVKIRFGDRRDINPYIRGGIGYYGGKAKSEFTWEYKVLADLVGQNAEDSETNFKGAIGFNGGIGLDIPISADDFMFIEAIYHFVQRQADELYASSFKANNFAVHLGYTFFL